MGVLMKCGHTAQAVDKHGNPVCVICIGIDPEATQVDKELPDLTGRKARCCYYDMEVRRCETHYPEMLQIRNGRKCCGSLIDSSFDLPFFEYRPDKNEDKFYCGCHSWD